MLSGLEAAMNPPGATWEYVDRLKKLTRMKLVLKGIETREDARLAREHGVDGIVVSNHGGRALDTNRSTIEALSEVIDGAGTGMPVFIDGGFRRGTDIFKALAMGARAVGVGRPYVWVQRVRTTGRSACSTSCARAPAHDAPVRSPIRSRESPGRWSPARDP